MHVASRFLLAAYFNASYLIPAHKAECIHPITSHRPFGDSFGDSPAVSFSAFSMCKVVGLLVINFKEKSDKNDHCDGDSKEMWWNGSYAMPFNE